MSQIEVHVDSIEDIYLPVRNSHPTTGDVDLSVYAVHVAIPLVGASPSSWVACTWASGTYRQGDDRYYVVTMDTDNFTFAAGSTYQPWVRVNGVGGAIIKVDGTIKAVNT